MSKMTYGTARLAVSIAALTFFLVTINVLQAREPQSGPIDAEYIEFEKSDNNKAFYFEYVPKTFDPSKKSTLIIALHGHGSDCGQIFKGAYNEFRATIDFAVSHNSVVVSPNYGSITSWMGPEAESDLVAIIAEQKAKRRYDQTIVSGASMGGSSTLTFVALHPELVDGAVSMNGVANHLEYENFQDAIAESFGGTKSEKYLEYKKRSAEYFPEAFLGKPLAVTLGSQDVVVQPDSARRLAQTVQKIGGRVLLLEREDIGHLTPYDESYQAFEFVYNALDDGSPKE